MNKDIAVRLHFYSADTSDTSIISYGDVLGIHVFKVVFHRNKYILYKMFSRGYKFQCEKSSLEDCIDYAYNTYDLNKTKS